MAKDPAFLFYSSDFLTGTMTMTNQQVGIYIRLLCFQHQHGQISVDDMQSLCGGIADAKIVAKFTIDENGNYFNERLRNEMIKRQSHSNKQKENALKRWQCRGNAVAMPLENENENVIEDVIRNKIIKKEETIFDEFLKKQCPTVLKLKTQMTADQAEKLAREFGFEEVCQILEAMENWIPLTKKSKSVYLTAKTWLTKRKETDGAKKLTYTDHAKQWFDATSKNSVFGSPDKSAGNGWDS